MSATTRTHRDDRRFQREVRRVHGADGWLLEWIAPLRNVRLGRFSVGEAAEIATFCLRHLREDRAAQIASALAFRTLFGLIPVMVVVTLAAKAMLGEQFAPTLRTLFESVGLTEVKIEFDSQATVASAETSSISLAQWLDELMAYASRLNVTALGWTGFVLVSLSAVWVLITIEEAFNTIYRCEQGRSWMRRILVYWFILTLGPLLLGLAPVLFGMFDRLTSGVASWDWLSSLLRVVVSTGIFWFALVVAYMTIPATKVAWRPAFIGAAVGAIGLEIGKASVGFYLQKAFGVSALYGSLGLVPLFMFWVYLMWLVILFGAEVAALLQAIRGRVLIETTAANVVADGEATVRAMEAIAGGFVDGRELSGSEVAAAARIPPLAASPLLDRLEDAGFVRRSEEGGVALARPAERIPIAEVLDVAWHALDLQGPADGLERKLRDAQRSAVATMTLADRVEGA
jgi:membrane protein